MGLGSSEGSIARVTFIYNARLFILLLTSLMSSTSDQGGVTTITNQFRTTITVTESGITSGSRSISSSSSHSTISLSSNVTSSSSPVQNAASETGDFITTTYVSMEGQSLVTITAVVTNPAARFNGPSDNSSSFLQNRAAVIGVFTALGLTLAVTFMAIFAWVVRRRRIKQRRKQVNEKASAPRNFFDDEDDDVVAPSEKSWWPSAGSGASIPEGNAGVSLSVMGGSQTRYSSAFSKSIDTPTSAYGGLQQESGIAHPYSTYSTRSNDDSDKFVMPIRDLRSPVPSLPPPIAPLPPTPANIQQSDYKVRSSMLPQILEADLSSSDGWHSELQPTPPGLTPPLREPDSEGLGLELNPRVVNQKGSSTSLHQPPESHPYASPKPQRKSRLLPEDVLWERGKPVDWNPEILGSSSITNDQLTDNTPPTPPSQPQPPNSLPLRRLVLNNSVASSLGKPTHMTPLSARVSPAPASSTGASAVESRPGSALGDVAISDGGWYDDDEHSAEEDGNSPAAAASGESDGGVLSNLPVDIRDRKKLSQDPRFSGLFGNAWNDTGAQLRQETIPNHRLSLGSGSIDDGEETRARRGGPLGMLRVSSSLFI